jgi:hypothetical protein
MGDLDDDIAREPSGKLKMPENQHVRVILRRDRNRDAIRRLIQKWGAWLFAAVGTAIAAANFLASRFMGH